MAKSRPGTGQARQTDQPLKIDRLPPSVHEAILHLRNQRGKTWDEIAALSALPFDAKGQGGFVDWEKLETPVLELFPDLRIPRSNLHRWYDIRVDQVQKETMHRSVQARELAASFSKAVVEDDQEAVINAARDVFFSLLAEDPSLAGRAAAGTSLGKLAEVMQKVRANDIKERKVAVEEKVLQIKLDLIKQKAGELLDKADGSTDGTPAKTREEILQDVKEIYGVA